MHQSTLTRLVVLALALGGCGSDSFSSGADASPKSDSSAADANAADANVPDAVVDDAGRACPWAEISHPGNGETRSIVDEVPFTGSAREANCVPISGGSLVWTESLTGKIGTGENFAHRFMVPGTRTITLTATEGNGNTLKATITLTMN